MTDQSFELDRANNMLVLKRTISASPESLFDAWTKPEQISKWWDPSGRELAECVIDLRVGGVMRLVNEGQEQHPFEGRYREIDPPYRIVFNAMGAVGSVQFDRNGDYTHLTVTMKCASPEQLEQFVRMGIGEGTARSLNNLDAYIRGV